MTYPIAISDTGALPEPVTKALDLAIAQPTITGAALGLLIGHFVFKNALAGAALGAIGGKFIISGSATLIR